MDDVVIDVRGLHKRFGELHVLRLTRAGDGLELGADPLNGRVKWRISTTP